MSFGFGCAGLVLAGASSVSASGLISGGVVTLPGTAGVGVFSLVTTSAGSGTASVGVSLASSYASSASRSFLGSLSIGVMTRVPPVLPL